MQHPSGIPEKIVEKVVARRGRLHAFETIDPTVTALVVIDLEEEEQLDARQIDTVLSAGIIALLLKAQTDERTGHSTTSR